MRIYDPGRRPDADRLLKRTLKLQQRKLKAALKSGDVDEAGRIERRMEQVRKLIEERGTR